MREELLSFRGVAVAAVPGMRVVLFAALLLGCGGIKDEPAGWHILPDGGADVSDEVGAQCASGLTACSGQCIDTNNDPANCGGCGASCPAMSTCTAGACFVNDPQ